MQDKLVFIVNGIYILKNIYKDKIEIDNDNGYTIKYNGKVIDIKTKYGLKNYIRSIISSDNKRIHEDIQSLLRLKYQLDKEQIITLKEIFPNFDLFISTYLKVINENIKIKLDNFTYEEFVYYLVDTYIKHMKDKQNKEAYLHITGEEKKLNEEIAALEEKLERYLIVKKNRFYYETYLKSIEYESETYKENKQILELNIDNINKEIASKEKELNKLSNKKITLHKKERMRNYNHQINDLIEEKEHNLEELQNLESKDKMHSNKNKDLFKEYVTDISLEEYEKNYNELKDLNAKELLDDINSKKTKLNKKIEEIAVSEYPETHLILKHYCLDNLRTFDLKSDMKQKIVNDIIKLLNENKN